MGKPLPRGIVDHNQSDKSLTLSKKANEIVSQPSIDQIEIDPSNPDIHLPCKISEWPSHSNLLQSHEKKKHNLLSCSSCYQKSHGNLSKIYGKSKSNRPKIALIDYFIQEIEKPNGKLVPTSPALITNSKLYSYQEVHDLSTRIARLLKSFLEEMFTSNPDEDIVVGLALKDERDKSIILKLAIMKLGCCYLPIDINNLPPNQIFELFEKIQPVMIIASNNADVMVKLKRAHDEGMLIKGVEEIWEEISIHSAIKVTKGSLFLRKDYKTRPIAIFYSPGPLGPIGIRIPNPSVWNRIYWEWETFPYKQNEILIHQSPIYDVQSIGELFTPLLAGKTIVIVDFVHMDDFLQNMKKHKITRIHLFPTLLRSILATEVLYTESSSPKKQYTSLLDHIKLWFCYRASLRADIAERFFKMLSSDTKLIQIHGVLETLQLISFKVYKSMKCIQDMKYYEVLPAGQPIQNTRVYITDEHMNLVEQETVGEISVSGLQLPESYTGSTIQSDETTTAKYFPNPFCEPGDDVGTYGYILRTGDYGRILPGGIFNPPSLIFDGRVSYQFIMNNQRVNIQAIILHLKAIHEIISCHVMVYRPCTPDQAVLAFIVLNRRKKLTANEIIERLRKDIPEYMMPIIILSDGLPINKDFVIDRSALLQAFWQDRHERMRFNDWDQLKLHLPEEIRAAKVLFEIIFILTGTSKKTIAEHMDWPIDKLRVGFSNLPLILLKLKRNGYDIGFDEIIEMKDVRELIKKMAYSREGKGNTEIMKWTSSLEIEPFHNKLRAAIQSLHCNSLTGQYGIFGFNSLSFYAGIKKKHLDEFYLQIWPELMAQPQQLSVAVKKKDDGKIVGTAMNFDYSQKANLACWKAKFPLKYRLEFIDSFDKDLDTILSMTPSERMLQTVFITTDQDNFKVYDEAVPIIDLLYKGTIEVAKKNSFKFISVISFDFVITSTLVDNHGFEILNRREVNFFEAADGSLPFKLAPVYIDATLLLKTVHTDSE